VANEKTPTISAAEKAAARAQKASGTPAAKPVAKKTAAKKAGTGRAKYKDHVVQRSKLVRLVPGYKNPASPKQQDFMDRAFTKALKKAGGETTENLLVIAGLYGDGVEVPEGESAPTFESASERLAAFARSEGGSTKPLKALVGQVDEAAAIRPRHVAAALIAYGWQLDGTAEDRLAAAAPAKKEDAGDGQGGADTPESEPAQAA
jgi:hypothetical protein